MMLENLENEIIERAIKGEHEAQMQVLKYYEWYINKVSMVTVRNGDGKQFRYVDEDFKAEVQIKYLESLSKCRLTK